MISAKSSLIPSWLNKILCGQIYWTLLVILLTSGVFLFSPLDRNYTSGELLDQLSAFIQGDFFSPLLEAPYRVFNYPPLFHSLVYIFHHLGLNLLTAGRLLNLIAFLGCSLLVYRWIYQECRNHFTAWITLGLIGACYPLLTSLGQIQLQLTAVFFSLSGLFLLNFSTYIRNIFFAGILLALACFTKQTQALTAVTALLWCFCYRRSYFFPLLFGFLLSGLVGLTLLQMTYGPQVWVHLLDYTVGSFSLHNLEKQLLGHIAPWIVLFGLALYRIYLEPQKRKKLAWWYLISSTLGLLSSARLGSSAMYFVEWSWALLIWIGPYLPKILESKSRILKLLFLIQLLLGDLGVAAVLSYDAKQVINQTQIVKTLCLKLPQTPQTLVASHPGLIQACKHNLAFYPFIVSSLIEQNLWNSTPLLQDLEKRKFSAVLLEFPMEEKLNTINQERWHPKILKAMMAHYKFSEKIGGFYLYLPVSDKS